MLTSRTVSVWASVILWMAVIFAFSSIPDLRSGLVPLWDLILRKIAHALEYAILGWLTFRAFEQSGASRSRAAILGMLVCIAYAGSDEWHQTFVLGRQGRGFDVVVDAIGAVVGIEARQRRI